MIYTSPAGDLENPYNGNAVQFIKDSKFVQQFPDVKAYIDVDTDEYLTTKQVLDLIGRVHTVLIKEFGIKYDDAVCLFAPNSIYQPVIQHGIGSMGGVCSPANAQYLPEELAHQISTSDSKLVVVSKVLEETALKAIDIVAKSKKTARIILLDELIRKAYKSEYSNPINIKDGKSKHLLYCFSSGTSGLPKGVITTHQNMCSNVEQNEKLGGQDFRLETTTGAGFLPMSHMYGLSVYNFQSLYKSCSVVVFPKFEFEKMLKAVVKYKISQLALVPPIVLLLAKSPLVDKYPEVKDIIKMAGCGAAPLSSTLADDATTRLGEEFKVIQGYGLTETSPTTHNALWDIENYASGSIGWLVPGVTARIVDTDTGKDGERGELWLKGPNVFAGYLKMDRSAAFTEDGWFKTGDVAIIDKSGQFYIVDRAKELIKVKGLQVAPAELEGLLLKHPGVVDAAVIGVWDEEQNTEFPRAFVQLSQNADALEVKRWLDDGVANHKKLRAGVVVLDAVPKSPSGKILRRYLRERKGDKVLGLKKDSKL